jgi:prepilin-type N-terminal cleavage/methylation domain-containing protein
MPNTKSKMPGFTIVELLIVIVVIAILAAITIVAYNGIQERGRDAARESDLASLAKLLTIYKLDHDDFMGTGSGCGGAGGSGIGWLDLSDGVATQYPKSIMQCLIDANVTSKSLKDPSGTISCGVNTVCHAYMKYNCANGKAILLANLESTPSSTTSLDMAVAQCPGMSSTIDDSYGMNYWVFVD